METAALAERSKKSPAPFGPLMTAVSFGLIGAGFAVLLSLAWPDVIIGTVLSMVVYGVVLLLSRSPTTGQDDQSCSRRSLAAILAYADRRDISARAASYVMVTLCAVIALVPNPGLILGPG